MNDLLKVLDISEEEQYNWLWQRSATFGFDLKWIDFDVPSAYDHSVKKEIAKCLADLAFRLRDEAMSSRYLYSALLDVHQKAEGPQNRKQDFGFWFLRAKPIHWIIAALIAKEKENESDDGS